MLFKLIKAKGATGGMLGYDFIEVLAVEPFALYPARRPNDYKKGRDGVSKSWAEYGVSVLYICRTEHGLTKLCERDLWAELECGEYCEDSPEGHKQAKKYREIMANPPWQKKVDLKLSPKDQGGKKKKAKAKTKGRKK